MTSSTSTFQYVITTAGTYTYDCTIHPSVMTGTITVTAGSTGITETPAESTTLKIYPNPFTTTATVKYILPAESKPATLVVYDLLGRAVDTYQLPDTEGQLNINANNLIKGIYFYAIMVDEKVLAIRKVMVD